MCNPQGLLWRPEAALTPTPTMLNIVATILSTALSSPNSLCLAPLIYCKFLEGKAHSFVLQFPLHPTSTLNVIPFALSLGSVTKST